MLILQTLCRAFSGQLLGRAGVSAEGGQGPPLPLLLRATPASDPNSGKSGIVWFFESTLWGLGYVIQWCSGVLVTD